MHTLPAFNEVCNKAMIKKTQTWEPEIHNKYSFQKKMYHIYK